MIDKLSQPSPACTREAAAASQPAEQGEDAARWQKLTEWIPGTLPMARVQVMFQGQYRIRSLNELISDIDAARAAQGIN